MSCPPSIHPFMPDKSDSSDYGSDFTPDEEEELNEILAKVAAEHVRAPVTLPPPTATHTQTTPVGDIEDSYHAPSSPRTPRVLGRQKPAWQVWKNRQTPAGPMANGRNPFVEHPASTEGRAKEREAQKRQWSATVNETNAVADTRSPIERFRKPPNKAFSVTDFISPAWCELQYWYTLTKYGRKRRTAAMKQGTTIHKTLEDQIYTTVSVEITTKEDALALRIWNIIQGLRTLREFGITRELEIWGLVDGELVNGVIDQLSYECPDPDLEATAASYYAGVEASRAVLPEYQMSLTDYLLSPSQGGKRLSDVSWHGEQSADDPLPSSQSPGAFSLPRIYMTDVKTRGNSSVPTVKSSSFRPTLLQLQMYYHMLNRLATSDDITIDTLASRYGLDPTRPFTDTFISEVGGLNDEFFESLSSQEFDPDFIMTPEDAHKHQSSEPPASQDSTSILLEHNNLTSLWSLMRDQFRLTFLSPPQAPPVTVAPSIPSESQPPTLESYPTVLSPLLTARYLSSAPPTDSQSRLLGSRSFLFDPTSLTSYLSDQMEWWRGERNPRGVEAMEAWKCRICEFKDECSWRQEREWAFARRRSTSVEV
ncbi:exonuclease V a 5' deoxyribonuclease-domain-containing protein [Aspergillus avenaceus]|uniref:Exonuclease V a 5' deoxyribonuclease-domain-containing protein n=1 Tax=Aspergillus avenaceus TaxID=36643 RepID=A0A5N6U716_ASPAV|nr:exonuclease V a 5' deoxyribonuclease-domain-containing protein [Aspergillus avenaceus]